MNSTPHTQAGESRRVFIKKAATVTALAAASSWLKTPVYGQSQAPSAGRVIGANDRIAVAYIGTGSQGQNHIRNQQKHAAANNITQAAVCDLYQRRLEQAREIIGLSPSDTYADHRTLLERKDVDAVIVSTVDVWHAQVTLDALAAGKHVYCEKPMARYLPEGFEVYDAVKRAGKVFQIGSQFCADPKIHKAAEWILAGKLGPLVWGQGSYCRNNYPRSEWTYPIDKEANEGNLDWARWQGKAKKVLWDPNRYFSWHKFYDYNSGILGNLLAHKFMPMMQATGRPEFPRRVCCTGTHKVSTDREITDTTHLLAEYPSGLTFVVAGSIVNEQGLPDIIRGLKGTLYLATSKNKVEFKPERPFAEELEAETFEHPQPEGDLAALEKNFFDCVRSGATPYGNVDLAIRCHTVLCLAEMAERLSLTLLFDEKTRTIKTGEGKVVPPLNYDTVLPKAG